MTTEKVQRKVNSIVENFFYGEVDEDQVFPYPRFSQEEKEMAKEMSNVIRRWGETLDLEKMDEEADMPEEVIQAAAEMGLCGLGVPEEHNGMGLNYTLYSRVFSEVCTIDGSISTMLGAHQSIGYRALINDGSDEQKQKWLPILATGEKIAAFCLTEPGSGSDAYSIKTKAVKNADGSYTITGQKLWITNGGRADFYTVFAKTDHEIDGKQVEKISCFIVEKTMEGVSFGEKENKMGIRASETRAVYFDKVQVPAANLIGEPGKGFKVAMKVLNSGRLSLGSGCVGGMKTIMKMAVAHAKGRKQFDRPIAEFGLIQDKIAQMAAYCYATESLVYLTTGNIDRGMEEYQLESAVCKIFGSESLWKVVDMGLQIAAGNGYMKEYPYERLMRDSRINLIFEGTNEILRVFIALSGLRGPSEKMKDLGKITDVDKVLKDPIKSVGVLTDFARGRLSKMMGGRSLTKVHPDLSEFSENWSSMLSGFAIQVENTLIKYGKKIIGNELPQGRLANMAVELYAQLAVMGRTTSILNDPEVSADDKQYVMYLTKLAIKESRHRFIANLKEMKDHSDKVVKSLSDEVCKRDGYALDVVDF